MAIEMLLWGASQPFAGALADRFGAVWVLIGGALLYIAGTVWMAYATTPLEFHLSAGVLIGFGLGGCSFGLVMGAFGKLLPESWRTIGFGAGTAAGSFGQFLFSPLAVALIDGVGWQNTLLIFAAIMLADAAAGDRCSPRRAAASGSAHSMVPGQSVTQALAEALRAPQLRAADARLLHLRLPAVLHHRAPAGLSGRPRAAGLDRRLDHRA